MEEIKLSVLDIEKKYTIDIEEAEYGGSDRNIVQWGKNNDAPVLYKNCYKNSATLKSVIDGSVNYVIGDSIKVNAEYWAKEVNRRGMSMRSFVAHLAMNYFVYGGFAFQVIFNKLGCPAELFALDFGRCRTNKANSKVWYNNKWSKYGTKAEEFDAYGQKFDINHPTQIYYFKGDFTSSVYPLPPYFGAINDVLTEVECSKYSLNSISNGLMAKYVLNFPENNNLTDEQKQGLEDAIRNKFCGSEAPANFLMYWGDGTNRLEVSKIEGDETPERFVAIRDAARQNIFISFRATPLLFGLPNASNGFSTNEYRDSAKLFEKLVIDPVRDSIKEAIDKVTGVENSITITPMTISFDNED